MQPVSFVWLLFFVSCSSIISSCSAWRLEHHWMVIHNECLHSLSSTKGNLLKITFHESMILLSSSFSSLRSNRIFCSRRLQHWPIGGVCLCEHEVTQANRNSVMTPSTLLPLLEMLYLLQLMRWKCNHMVFSSQGPLLMSPMPIWALSGMSDWWGGQIFLGISDHITPPYCLMQKKRNLIFYFFWKITVKLCYFMPGG